MTLSKVARRHASPTRGSDKKINGQGEAVSTPTVKTKLTLGHERIDKRYNNKPRLYGYVIVKKTVPLLRAILLWDSKYQLLLCFRVDTREDVI